MLADLSETPQNSTIYELHDADLRHKLSTNSYFLSLNKALQKELLKGKDSKILSFKEISKRMGDGGQFIWGLYRFFSCHTHTTPLSFYRMGEQRRTGIENDVDKGYKAAALEFANEIQSRALNDFTGSLSEFVKFNFTKVPSSLNFLVKQHPLPNSQLPTIRAQRRNESCQCGSGKKYKKCHG
jgi:hypothetical protein